MSAGRPASSGLLHLAIGLTYLYGGLAIWDHEPANRTGRLMTLVGLTWFIGTLDLRRLTARQRARAGARGHAHGHPAGADPCLSERQARDDRRPCRGRGPRDRRHRAQRPLLDQPPALADKSNGLYGGLALATITAVVVVRRWVIAPRRSRRELAPVLVAGIVFLGGPDHQPVPPDRRAAGGRRGHPPGREGPGPRRDPDRAADRLLPPERATIAGAR